MTGGANDVFLRSDRTRSFQLRDHGAEQLRQRMREHLLAQCLAQHSPRQRFALVMPLQLVDHQAAQSLKTLARKINTTGVDHLFSTLRRRRDAREYVVVPTSCSGDIGKPQTTLAGATNKPAKLRDAIFFQERTQ